MLSHFCTRNDVLTIVPVFRNDEEAGADIGDIIDACILEASDRVRSDIAPLYIQSILDVDEIGELPVQVVYMARILAAIFALERNGTYLQDQSSISVGRLRDEYNRYLMQMKKGTWLKPDRTGFVEATRPISETSGVSEVFSEIKPNFSHRGQTPSFGGRRE